MPENETKKKIIDIIENDIKNVKNEKYEELINLFDINSSYSKVNIAKIIRNYLTIKRTLNRNTKEYWLTRGWSESESIFKQKEYRKTKEKRISPFSKEFWLIKVNPKTNKFYTNSEAEYKRNSQRPIKKEFWLEKGYNELESIKLAQETKISNNKKGAISSKNIDKSIKKSVSNTTIDYWLLRGYTKEQAEIKVSERQKTFSLKKCIEKYGENKGKLVWSERQLKWKKSLLDSGMYYGKSSIANDLFLKLKKYYTEILFGEEEQIIKTDNMILTVDCLYNKKIIEFNGDYWHANPKKYKETDIIKNKTALDIWNKDLIRKQELKNAGYEVLIVWECDYRNNEEKVINECLNFLKQ